MYDITDAQRRDPASRRKARAVRHRTLALGIVFVFTAASCGDDDNTAATTAPSGDGAIESVAMLLPGRADDPGYSGLGAAALQLAADQFGLETAVAESVDVAQQLEVYRDFASKGFDLVVGWGGQFEDGAIEAAEQFPDTYFAVGSGTGGNGSNYSSVDLRGEQWTFLIGYIAGKLTQSDKVGVVDGPCFDASARQANGFRDGAIYANPDVNVSIVGLDSFDDPAGAKEAALAQISQGVDMINAAMNTGNLGVFEAARESEGVLVLTEYVDQNAEAPEVILTSATRDQSVVIAEVVQRIIDGTFDGDPIRISITDDYDAIAPFRDLAPQALFDEAKELQAKIASGELVVEANGSCPFKGN